MAQEKLHIEFERSGGFAGMVNTLQISGDTLDADELTKLKELIEQSGFFDYQASSGASSDLPDQFQYKISIELGDQRNALELGESGINSKLRPLVDYLSQKARRRRG